MQATQEVIIQSEELIVDGHDSESLRELTTLELSLVGGGSGAIIFA